MNITRLTHFSSNLFVFLLGFLFGNLFPTFFSNFLGKIGTPLFLLVALDSFNFFYYSIAKAGGGLSPVSSGGLASSLQRVLDLQNFFKIGFLFGLFVDAFKVGS